MNDRTSSGHSGPHFRHAFAQKEKRDIGTVFWDRTRDMICGWTYVVTSLHIHSLRLVLSSDIWAWDILLPCTAWSLFCLGAGRRTSLPSGMPAMTWPSCAHAARLPRLPHRTLPHTHPPPHPCLACLPRGTPLTITSNIRENTSLRHGHTISVCSWDRDGRAGRRWASDIADRLTSQCLLPLPPQPHLPAPSSSCLPSLHTFPHLLCTAALCYSSHLRLLLIISHQHAPPAATRAAAWRNAEHAYRPAYDTASGMPPVVANAPHSLYN